MGYEEKPQEEIILGLFPDGILCMDSALYYYGYIEKRPYEWSIAISKNTSKSRFRMEYPVVKPLYRAGSHGAWRNGHSFCRWRDEDL